MRVGPPARSRRRSATGRCRLASARGSASRRASCWRRRATPGANRLVRSAITSACAPPSPTLTITPSRSSCSQWMRRSTPGGVIACTTRWSASLPIASTIVDTTESTSAADVDVERDARSHRPAGPASRGLDRHRITDLVGGGGGGRRRRARARRRTRSRRRARIRCCSRDVGVVAPGTDDLVDREPCGFRVDDPGRVRARLGLGLEPLAVRVRPTEHRRGLLGEGERGDRRTRKQRTVDPAEHHRDHGLGRLERGVVDVRSLSNRRRRRPPGRG